MVYSQSSDDRVMVTARFLSEPRPMTAILRVHEKVRANSWTVSRRRAGTADRRPRIDDVAIVSLTLSPKPEAADRITANNLTRIARELARRSPKIDDVGLTYLVGDTGEAIRIAPDPDRLALNGVTLQQLAAKVAGANRSFPSGMVRDGGEQVSLVAGKRCRRRGHRQSAADDA